MPCAYAGLKDIDGRVTGANMKRLTCMILLLTQFGCAARECYISGEAILWAYDACFWEQETDDSIHPGVMNCVDEAEKLIETVGACEAKRLFKSRICHMARTWKIKDVNPETCMSSDRPLGPAVRDGGI